ncbi:hypothetical protein C0J52_25073 [Blattella germanica]|nr:hypothetical protein C0J52_25073 [Blattella germanica]
MGLKINENKTKYMGITNNPLKYDIFSVDKYKIEKVKEFKYLGTIITDQSNIYKEINYRLTLGNRGY